MIKVELFYKVIMFETDWLMSEKEYEEFRTNALNLPLAFVKGTQEEVELELPEIKEPLPALKIRPDYTEIQPGELNLPEPEKKITESEEKGQEEPKKEPEDP